MPPPRLVKRNSTSELRNVSTFSAKVGPGSAPCGAASGEASGDGEAARIAGVAVDEVCPGRRSDGSRSGRHLFCQIHFPHDEPDHAKSDDNPRSSIHKFGFARSDAATDLVLRSARPARRHRVVPTSTPWLAASEALQSQPTSVPNAMRLHRFQKISRTGRGKSAAAVRTAKQTKQR